MVEDAVPPDTVTPSNDQVESAMEEPPQIYQNNKNADPSRNEKDEPLIAFDAVDGTAEMKRKNAPPASPPCTPKVKNLPNIPAATPREDCSDRIRLGICAMDKKARSKPMAEILSRLDEDLFCVVFFGDDVILNQPVQDWPECEVFIGFFSKGYPLSKAKEYVALRRPFILNDLEKQELLQDRRRVYDLLEASGIDVPRHVYLSRDGYVSTGTGGGNGAKDQEVKEFDDHIEVNGVSVLKPFVEKPVDAEDHNISIYYPTSAGGGCKKLFRKIGNRSSEFYPDINNVRRDSSYIYEAFVETQGVDVKMYTVGPEYGHAEARKSPTMDGKVERNSEGKEIRFPVILTFREKEIARRIVLGFKQFVCGFDILRVQEGHSVVSHVCDVNGWSFVKNSRKYYDDCAQVLSEHILAVIKPGKLNCFSTLDPLVTTSLNRDEAFDDKNKGETFLSRAARMLQGEPAEDDHQCDRSVATVGIENGSSASPTRLETHESNEMATTLVEGALPVREFPDVLTSLPASISPSANSSVADENIEIRRAAGKSVIAQGSHQEELRCVLAIIRHGDRTPKQKLKLNMTEPHILGYFHDHVTDCKKDLKVKAKAPMTEFLDTVKTTLSELERIPANESLRQELLHMRDVLERWTLHGLNRKLQIKPKKFETFVNGNGETAERCTEIQLVLKWGGDLTKLGEKQSMNLGQLFRRQLYPDAPGGGILRLHSTFRHDLKIKTSDEGRVMKTAAAFAKGLLELEGDLAPILVSLVHKEIGSMHMLDPSGNKEVKIELDECKEKITANLQRDIDVSVASEEDLEQLVGPKEISSIRTALAAIGNPRRALFEIYRLMGELIAQLGEMLGSMGSGDETQVEDSETDQDLALSLVKLYKGETLLELTERWRFIYDRLYVSETDQFDLSRIPDIHDNVRFDMLHNPHLGLTETLGRLYELTKNFADCVVAQEYGTTIAERRSVSVKICRGLLEKIKYDLGVARTDNQVDMRYLINMAYSSDLNINTMGRRIRTRLYCTSESHLHTVLNVLRFPDEHSKPILSDEGIEIINSAPELCYLTHIVMRVFEDWRPEMHDNPRRFRVEIMFSPGATSTPLHLGETAGDLDSSRFDTAPLQMIGREGLTCEELENYFGSTIMAGRPDDEEYIEAASLSTMQERIPRSPKPKDKKSAPVSDNLASAVFNPVDAALTTWSDEAVDRPAENKNVDREFKPAMDASEHNALTDPAMEVRRVLPSIDDRKQTQIPEEHDDDESESDLESVDTISTIASEIVRKVVARKHFWSTVAVGSFVLGAGCLLLALRLTDDSRQRRWSARRYSR